VLPGVNDQPSVVFAFPPAESEAYTWPQVFAGSADILEDPEAKGVFMAATKTNLATVLRVASHRIEIKDISAATRRSQGIKVEYLIHPDDTGKDNTSVEDLEERANSDAVRSAVVAGQASYATSAQTDNPNVNKIATDPSYSDVDEARKKQNEVEAANAVLIIVVAVLGGLLGCGCFCCLPVIVFMMRRKRKNGVAVMEAGQTTFAQPVAAPYSAPSAPQSVEPVALPAPPPAQLYPAPQPVPQPVTQQQQVPAVIFCSACGTRNENAKFCEKCGGALSF